MYLTQKRLAKDLDLYDKPYEYNTLKSIRISFAEIYHHIKKII